MKLMAIKEHMRKVRLATLGHLCSLFEADPETIRCLLSHFIRKGQVRKCLKTNACGSKCFKCPALSTEIYEWIDSAILN